MHREGKGVRHVFNAFRTTENNFFSMVSLEQIAFGHLIAFATGVEAPGLNPAIVYQVDESFETSLSLCFDFYAEKQLPWALILPDYYHNPKIADLLQQHHFILNGDNGVAMFIALEKIEGPMETASLEIREIQGNLAEWCMPLIEGFESTPEITRPYAIRHQLATEMGKKLYHFSGFIDNQIVCSLSLSFYENKARIDDIATRPQFQRKGYASALIFAALRRAKEYNARYCFLEASGIGLNLYKKIGFRELFTNYCYESMKY
ncbi:GNAT family N-acetyltransferase [Legionella nagasakiensis]|uniref:GNAT family N-acetyltransferase n=1 Tax=Legionella nagasakiensis TaxID=535290 RepID=UPI001054B052|nr:GNAT family N-acetyltransferase [Legionella nagasakiensis]